MINKKINQNISTVEVADNNTIKENKSLMQKMMAFVVTVVVGFLFASTNTLAAVQATFEFYGTLLNRDRSIKVSAFTTGKLPPTTFKVVIHASNENPLDPSRVVLREIFSTNNLFNPVTIAIDNYSGPNGMLVQAYLNYFWPDEVLISVTDGVNYVSKPLTEFVFFSMYLDRLDYDLRNCFHWQKTTDVRANNIRVDGQWSQLNQLINNGHNDFKFNTKWYRDNAFIQNGGAGISNVATVNSGSSTLIHCDIEMGVPKYNQQQPWLRPEYRSYTIRKSVKPLQYPDPNITYPNVGAYNFRVAFNVTGSGESIQFFQTQPLPSGNNPNGMSPTSGSATGSGYFQFNNLSPGVYRYKIYTGLRYCERDIIATVSNTGAVTVINSDWNLKVAFEVENQSAREITIAGISLTELAHTAREINIYNSAGSLVKSIPIYEDISERWASITIDVNELVRGAYFATIIDSEGAPLGDFRFVK